MNYKDSKEYRKSNLINIMDDENLRNSFLNDILTALSNAGIIVSQDKKILLDIAANNSINISVPIDGIIAKDTI